jgi:hypothetical protein
MWIGTKFWHEKVKMKRFGLSATFPREIDAQEISHETCAESDTGDAQPFDYVPISRLFPRFQNPPKKPF